MSLLYHNLVTTISKKNQMVSDTLVDEASRLFSQIEDIKHGRSLYPYVAEKNPYGKNPDIITIA